MRFSGSALFFFLLAGAASAQAQSSGTDDATLFTRDLSTARALGMGNAYSAMGLGTEAVMGSPATMSLHRQYSLDVGGFWDEVNKDAFGSVSLMDSVSSQVAAGAAYQIVSDGHGASRRTSNLTTVALGLPVAQALHLGVAGRQLFRTGADAANAITMDAGAALVLGVFSMAFTGHNLIDTRHPELARNYSLGFGVTTSLVNVAADVRSDLKDIGLKALSYSAGAELMFIPHVPLRGGYFYNGDIQNQGFSAGVGLSFDGAGVDLAYRQDLTGPGRLLIATVRIQLGGSQQQAAAMPPPGS